MRHVCRVENNIRTSSKYVGLLRYCCRYLTFEFQAVQSTKINYKGQGRRCNYSPVIVSVEVTVNFVSDVG